MKTTTQNANQKRQNQSSRLLSRPEQLSTGNRPRIDFKRRYANRFLKTETLLELLRRETPRFFEVAEVVGRWVWIQFDQKQPGEVTRVLAELGFHWNRSRQTWQHPCGLFRDKAASYDPREIYRSYFPADQKAA
jgi:hypothetical protein